MEFTNSLKHWFYYLSTQAAKPTSRVPMMDASGNPTGSSPASSLARLMYDVFYIDDNIDTPSEKITGDINGNVMRYIRRHMHRYLVKKTGEGQVAICQLSDSNSNYFYDGTTAATLDGTQGDVMVKMPRFYYKCEETTTLHKWKITLATRNLTGDMQVWEGNELLGAYEGVVVDRKLYSRSGVASISSLAPEYFKAYARARGTGYTIEKWQMHNVRGMLFYAENGTTDSQGVRGSGTNSKNKQTGQTNSLGMADTVNGGNGSSGSINNMGVENEWGSLSEYIDNVVVKYAATGNTFSITEDDGTVRTVTSQTASGEGYIFPTKMVLGEKFDLIPAPDNVSGDETQGYCDGFYMSTQSSATFRAMVSGSYNKAEGGIAFESVGSGTYSTVGARLQFKGEITNYTNISAFTALQEAE